MLDISALPSFSILKLLVSGRSRKMSESIPSEWQCVGIEIWELIIIFSTSLVRSN